MDELEQMDGLELLSKRDAEILVWRILATHPAREERDGWVTEEELARFHEWAEKTILHYALYKGIRDGLFTVSWPDGEEDFKIKANPQPPLPLPPGLA